MTAASQHPTNRWAPLTYAGLLALLPLVWPGLDGTSSDLLVKRLVLYGFASTLCVFWFWSFKKRSYKSSPLVLPALLYVFWNLLSLTWATNPFTGWIECLQLIVLFVLFLIFINFNLTEHLQMLAQAATTGGLVVSLIGIAQYLGLGFENMLSVGLPSSTFIFRNLAAAYLLAVIPLALFAFLNERHKSHALLWVLSLCTMLLYLFYTRTRGAWVSLVSAFILACICLAVSPPLRQSCLQALHRHWSVPIIRWGIIICTVFLFAGATRNAQTSVNVIQQFDEKKTTASTAITSLLTPGSDRGRFTMWKHTWTIFKDHPIHGVGLDSWEYIYPRYDKGEKITDASEPVRPHNDILWITSELGLIGLGFYLYLLFKATSLSLKTFARPNTNLSPFIALIGLASLIGYSMFSFPKEQPVPSLFFWTFLAIIGTSHTTTQPIPKIVLLPSIAISLCAFYLTTRNITFDTAYQQARILEQNSRFSKAYTEMGRALKAGSFDHRAHFLKAQYLQKMGRNSEATAAYLNALKFHPNYAHTHHNLGGVYAAQKAYTKAIDSYKTALTLRPKYYQAQLHLGNAYAATNQTDLAIGSFHRAILTNPNFAEAHTNLGALYLRKEAYKNAIDAFEEAIRLQPDNAQAHNNLAYAYEQTGHVPEAIVAYENLLKHWKGDPAYRETVRQHLTDLRNQSKKN